MIDYQSFLTNLIARILGRSNLKQPILLISSESCVGICDVLLLEQIILNILELDIAQIALKSPTKVRLTKPSAEHLTIQVEFFVPQTAIAQVLPIFESLVNKNTVPLTSDRDLNLAVVSKCVHLLQGKIELASSESSISIAVKLPLILTINPQQSTDT